jgi:hypothetical protein
MSDQTGNGSATRMILAQHLAQEDPQRDQRRIDSIQPNRLDSCHRLHDDLLGENVGKWQLAILKKLTL